MAVDVSVGPGFRQGAQKVYPPGVALQEHLGDTRRAAKVAVDLKRRMVIEKVRMRTLLQEQPNMLAGLLAVEEPGLKIDNPCAAPAGMASAVLQAPSNRLARRG